MKIEELLPLLLPEGMLNYFEITKVEQLDDSFILNLSEVNTKPELYMYDNLHSKGFYDPITIQDFPLRGKPCYLKVKRRRWLNIDTGTIVMRDWDMVARGSRMTVEFATFLKELNRYHTS